MTLAVHKSTAWVPVIDSKGFTLGLATYGEPGYAPFKPDQRQGFATWDKARTEADIRNEHIGTSLEDALEIMLDSMRRQHDR